MGTSTDSDDEFSSNDETVEGSISENLSEKHFVSEQSEEIDVSSTNEIVECISSIDTSNTTTKITTVTTVTENAQIITEKIESNKTSDSCDINNGETHSELLTGAAKEKDQLFSDNMLHITETKSFESNNIEEVTCSSISVSSTNDTVKNNHLDNDKEQTNIIDNTKNINNSSHFITSESEDAILNEINKQKNNESEHNNTVVKDEKLNKDECDNAVIAHELVNGLSNENHNIEVCDRISEDEQKNTTDKNLKNTDGNKANKYYIEYSKEVVDNSRRKSSAAHDDTSEDSDEYITNFNAIKDKLTQQSIESPSTSQQSLTTEDDLSGVDVKKLVSIIFIEK